jgi:hypothetical protein
VAEAAFDEEVGGDVVEALGLIKVAEGGEAFGRAGPVEGRSGGGRDGGVVGVGVEAAVAAEGEDDVGADAADALDEGGGEGGERAEFELAVVVVEEFVVVDAEDAAGGGELGAAEKAEFMGGGGGAAVGAGAAVGEAEDAGFDAALGCESEGSAEGKTFVVGVGGDAEKS